MIFILELVGFRASAKKPGIGESWLAGTGEKKKTQSFTPNQTSPNTRKSSHDSNDIRSYATHHEVVIRMFWSISSKVLNPFQPIPDCPIPPSSPVNHCQLPNQLRSLGIVTTVRSAVLPEWLVLGIWTLHNRLSTLHMKSSHKWFVVYSSLICYVDVVKAWMS